MAQNVSVTAKVDSISIPIGQQTTLHLFVHAPAKQQVIFPVITDSLAPKLQVVKLAKTDTLADKDAPSMQTIRRNYLITSFDAGSYTIPPLTFKIGNDSVQSNPVSLEVKPVKVDTTKAIYDIKQPLTVTYSFAEWLRDNWLWIIITLLLAAAAITLIWYLKKRPKADQPVVKTVKPQIPFHTLALSQLNGLREKKLWQQEQIKEYYSELSDIIREYLEARYAIKTHEKTTDEILSSLSHAHIEQKEWNRLQQILMLADLVKFAKERPLPTDNEQCMDNAIAFVLGTPTIKTAEPKEGGVDGLV